MNIIEEYKILRKKRLIEQAPLDESERGQTIRYADRRNYTFRMRYKLKYHFGEIFNRIICLEKNKPESSEIAQIEKKLNNIYTLNNIYRHSSYNQRKHLVYIWHILNEYELPVFNKRTLEMKECILGNLVTFYGRIGVNKAYKYRLVIDVICEHFKFNSIRNLLYFKDNKEQREKVKEVLKFS